MQRGLSVADAANVSGCIVLKREIGHFLEQINSGTYKYDGRIDHEKQAALTRLFTTRNAEEWENIKHDIDAWETEGLDL